MLSGFVIFVSVITGFYLLFKIKNVDFSFIFSLSLTPVTIALVLYYLFLIVPGNPPSFYVACLMLFSLFFLCSVVVYLFRVKKKFSFDFDFYFLIPLLLSSVMLFFIPHFFADYDPINYAMIGREIAKECSVRGYPFVQVGVHRHVFSFFSHPPALPLIYSFLFLIKLPSLIYFVGFYYYAILNAIIFGFFKKNTDLLTATLVVVLFAFTPGVFEFSRSNFTGPIRLTFFILSFIYILEYDLSSAPVVLSGGFTLFSHSIGVLVVFSLFLASLLKRGNIRLKDLIRGYVAMFFIGGVPYFINLLKFGALDTRPYLMAFYGKVGKDFVRFQFEERNLVGFSNRIKNGYLNFLFNLKMFAFSLSVSFLFYIYSVLKFFKSKKIVRVSTAFVFTYFIFHFSPLKGGIFLMSYRYVLTVFPVVLVALIEIFKLKRVKFFLFLFVVFNLVFVLLFSNPFYRKVFWYKKMKDRIDFQLSEKDKVLVVHSPSFFFYNEGGRGVDIMDPTMSHFYRIKDLKRAVFFLKENGFTHILMPYKPDPFVTDTEIEGFFTHPYLVKPVVTYYQYSLYKIDYRGMDYFGRTPETVFRWDSSFPVVFYKNKKDAKGGGKVEIKGGKIFVKGYGKGYVFAFAKDKLWKKNSMYIRLNGEKWIIFSFKVKNLSNT